LILAFAEEIHRRVLFAVGVGFPAPAE